MKSKSRLFILVFLLSFLVCFLLLVFPSFPTVPGVDCIAGCAVGSGFPLATHTRAASTSTISFNVIRIYPTAVLINVLVSIVISFVLSKVVVKLNYK